MVADAVDSTAAVAAVAAIALCVAALNTPTNQRSVSARCAMHSMAVAVGRRVQVCGAVR